MRMAKESGKREKGSWKKNLKTSIAASGFVTAIVLVLVLGFAFGVDLQTVGIVMAVAIFILAGVPLAYFAIRGTARDNEYIRDENATCQPIMKKYWNSHNTKNLVKDYEEWTKGEHSSYTRVHFGGDVIGELQDAKQYEEALRLLDELGNIEMTARERYDYETYREKARPQLLEGVEQEKKRAEERARNKNLK